MAQENNELIIERMAKDPYTKNSMFLLKRTLNIFSKGILKMSIGPIFENLKFYKSSSKAFKSRFDYTEYSSELVMGALEVVRKGDYLMKYHLSTNGHKKQFFKVVEDGLRWSSSPANINREKGHKREWILLFFY